MSSVTWIRTFVTDNLRRARVSNKWGRQTRDAGLAKNSAVLATRRRDEAAAFLHTFTTTINSTSLQTLQFLSHFTRCATYCVATAYHGESQATRSFRGFG